MLTFAFVAHVVAAFVPAMVGGGMIGGGLLGLHEEQAEHADHWTFVDDFDVPAWVAQRLLVMDSEEDEDEDEESAPSAPFFGALEPTSPVLVARMARSHAQDTLIASREWLAARS